MSSGASTNPGLRGELARLLAARNLKAYLAYIWERYFADVPRVNEVQIAYCRPWKSRLGLIRMSLDETTSFIGINALLQHELVPEYVLITTVAHELAHYAHGFGSPLPRLYAHPHANNVVNCELERRGLGTSVRQCDAWIDREWFAFYDTQRELGWAEIPCIHLACEREQIVEVIGEAFGKSRDHR
ncbi:MAG TPA: hypothetical protein VKV40_17865 [Ktedonobacteraceae bacterium]|nr:hypothetical protein [Ktedonobacteraceae bacterium]